MNQLSLIDSLETSESNTLVSSAKSLPVYLRASIDWLSGSFNRADLGSISTFFGLILGEQPSWKDARPLVGFQCSLISPEGIRLNWSNDRMRAHLSIPGSVIAACDATLFWEAARHLESAEFRATRMDVALDIFKEGLLPPIRQLWDWYKAGHLKNGRKATYICGNPSEPEADLSKIEGLPPWIRKAKKRGFARLRGQAETMCIGRRGRKGGGAFTRIYNKGAQYSITEYWQRVETEFSADTAWKVFDEIFALYKEHGLVDVLQSLPSYANYRIAFSENESIGDHRARKMLPEWQRYLDAVAASWIETYPVRKKKKGNTQWFRRQYSGFLATLFLAGAPAFADFLTSCLAEGIPKVLRQEASLVALVPWGRSCPI